MRDLVREWLKSLGEDPEREGLLDTPVRVEETWKYLTRGYRQNIDEVLNGAIFNVKENHMIIVKDIEIYSLCEHHMLPFFGKCHIGYIPNGRVLGVSKLARIADMFARRLQIQERLTNQIAEVIMNRLEPVGVGVVIEAKHLCMMMRGVEKQNSCMITSAMLGNFRRSAATRNEFLEHLRVRHAV
ncbi:MAG: GTP cyclohydrolase I FolE [Kiritimatiellae bacterium]|nr:GTP cyclohydrolase I FolE [Kiritimatiellia bacterium]MDD4736190.1 GTP cyclohydrolase I FolE [Kiritimatiellia bacterium]